MTWNFLLVTNVSGRNNICQLNSREMLGSFLCLLMLIIFWYICLNSRFSEAATKSYSAKYMHFDIKVDALQTYLYKKEQKVLVLVKFPCAYSSTEDKFLFKCSKRKKLGRTPPTVDGSFWYFQRTRCNISIPSWKEINVVGTTLN